MSLQDTMVPVDIPIKDIFVDEELNCRGAIAPYEVIELSKSIEEQGLLQPVTVQPYDKIPPYKYRLLIGHRRHKAFQILKRQSIPALIKEGMSDTQARIINLQENLARKDLNMVQEARAIFKFRLAGYTIEDVAKMVNMSTGWVQVRYALLSLPEEIQEAAAAGFLTQEQIKDIYSLKTKEQQFEAVKKIKESRLRGEKKAIKVKKVKKNPLSKRPRKREEIFEMQEHIQEYFGNNLGTRCLAWAAGEISDLDLYEDLRQLAKEKQVSYHVPLPMELAS